MGRKKTILNIQYPTLNLKIFNGQKNKTRIYQFMLVIFVFILWEHVHDFIDGQGLEFERKHDGILKR